MEKQRTFIAIDLKSFYASVECVERGLDPLRTNLVVADLSRTEKTICLAVTPSLKAYGIGGRARLFEVVQRVREVNMERLCFSPEGIFRGKSFDDTALQSDLSLELEYIVAPPRMNLYVDYSTRIFKVYLRHFASEDIFPYSIDEAFIDATNYLGTRHLTPREMATILINDVIRETGITATVGIGTNVYLSKVAMDIVAKHVAPDASGVRIAELDEKTFRQQLWSHRPLSDFWLVGRATQRKLEANGMKTMGDVARRSLYDEDWFYRTFGIQAELLIDHAWGWEPVRLEHVHNHKPQNSSLSSGQVLKEPYPSEKARIVAREMADNLGIRLMQKDMETSQLVLSVGYDSSCIDNDTAGAYTGEVVVDYYGRLVPVPAHGSINLPHRTNSSHILADAVVRLFDKIVNPKLTVRRINIAASHVTQNDNTAVNMQLGLFDNQEEVERQQQLIEAEKQRDARLQKATIAIKERFGGNAILRGTNFEQGATARERNNQIGGHKA